MKGRPNTPTHLRAIEGNRGKRSLDTLEPEVPVIDGDAPAYLEGPALEMWNTLLPLLIKHVGLTVLDRPKLEMYCASYGRYRLATMALTKDGVTSTTYTVKGRNGNQIKTRPEYHQMLEEVRLMHSLGAEMGLSPAARARLKGLAQGDLFDELDELNRRYQSVQGKSQS
jgi:P27 family predicted phage terminase small subunit